MRSFLDEVHVGDVGNELSSVLSKLLFLSNNFLSVIPREQECVGWMVFCKFIVVLHWYMSSGAELTLLDRGGIRNKFNKIWSNPAIVSDGSTLGCCAIANDSFAFLFSIQSEDSSGLTWTFQHFF